MFNQCGRRCWSGNNCLLLLLALIVCVNCACLAFVSADGYAAQKAGSSKAPGLQNPPRGWEVVRETEVKGAQLSQIATKVGTPMKSVFNSFVRYENKELQINTITTQNEADALRLKESLRKGKSNPRWIVQNKANVYEFVVRSSEDARVAAAARRAFSIIPAARSFEVKFDAIPILSEESGSEPDVRNRLFNLLLQVPAKPALETEIETLSKKFKFADDCSLVKDLQGQVVVDWKSTKASVKPLNGELVKLVLSNSDKKFGMPWMDLSATVKIDTNHKRKIDATLDKKDLLAANSRFPTQSAELQQLVGKLVAPNDSDATKLRKLLNWFSDSKNIRYDGLTGSRYGADVVLKQHFGRCWDYSDLFITMARIAGLPSRQVYGWLYESEGHVWCDVIVDGQWQMVDPTSGTECDSDYLPFCVSATGEFPMIYAGKVAIK